MPRQEGRHTPLFDQEDALTTDELVFLQLLAFYADYDANEILFKEDIPVSATAPVSPAINDLWVDIS